MPAYRIAKAIFLSAVFILVWTGGVSEWGNPVKAAISTYSIKVDGKQRTYVVYAPLDYHSKKLVPVVVMLHGLGGTGEGVIQETGWDKKADQEGFLVVFPDGILVNQEAEPNLLTNPQIWNDGSKRGQSLLPEVDDVKFLSLILDDLAKAYTIDRKAVFGTGFSSGASMLFKAVNELPGRFAAIAPVSGHYWPASAPLSVPLSIPTLLIVGTADPLNPFDGGTVNLPWGLFEQPPLMNTIQNWAKHNGWFQTLKPAPGQSGVEILQAVKDNRVWYRVYIVEGLGHMWPGGAAVFPESFIGKDPGTLQATDVIWRFFDQVRSQSR